MKSFKHVKVLKTGLDRNLFTRQGMHMNNLGKERIALEMGNEATKILSKQAKVISLQWKNNSTSDDNLEEISPLQVPPLQHLLRSDVNGDLGQLGTDGQGSKIALAPRSLGVKVDQAHALLSNVINNETEIADNDNPRKEMMDEADKQVIEEQRGEETSDVSVTSVNSAIVTNDSNTESPAKSERLRKAPIARSNDFLW
jgi:hypothetical protein